MRNRDFYLGAPFHKMVHVEREDGQHCLIIRLSHAQYDGMSLPRLLRRFGDDVCWREYLGRRTVFCVHGTDRRRRSFRQKRSNTGALSLNGSSLSFLGLPSTDPREKSDVPNAASNDRRQPLEDITTANLLTAAWALVVARRLRLPDVTFGSITSGRSIELANVDCIMGPCYQFTPVRVPIQPH